MIKPKLERAMATKDNDTDPSTPVARRGSENDTDPSPQQPSVPPPPKP